MIAVSIVSHGQGELVAQLLQDIRANCKSMPLHVLLTLNIEEQLPFNEAEFPFPIQIIKNRYRRGFAANHNAAFKVAHGEYFCVLNPDIRFHSDPFPALVAGLADTAIGVTAPLVTGPQGQIEDSARLFPTPLSIARKAFCGQHGPDYAIEETPIQPDWVAGMFMLWRADMFRRIGGFDERFFLYYEDVDACARLHQAGFRVQMIPAVKVIHHARRASHRNLRYLRWHLTSMLRFFWKQFVG